jgi:hypothetical protein
MIEEYNQCNVNDYAATGELFKSLSLTTFSKLACLIQDAER